MRADLYYASMKRLAIEKRRDLSLDTASICLSRLREIYKTEGITIDLRKLPARIRGVYMCEDNDCSVLINKGLPDEPRIFTMVHELKHHYCDRALLAEGGHRCGDYNKNQTIEIGAEVFAAEFIFPESEFLLSAENVGLEPGTCTPEGIVEFKRTCGARVSFTFLRKGLERLGFISKDEFAKTKFTLVEERMYGKPFYKEDWFKNRRRG